MIPILYDTNETAFVTNGLGRLRDCISCVVTEERNGLFECDFEYPITGANYEKIQLGRIIAVTHDDTGDVQPFDIISYSRPINGVVTFHAVHISYRQSYLTVSGTNINSLSDAFTMLGNAEPSNPFSYTTDKSSTGYLAAADGIPRTVRSMLGGVEGSILDAYGGEYKFDKFTVSLLSARGQLRNFKIRYGVNMLDYNEDGDSSGTYSSVIPYWTNGTVTVVGDRQDGGSTTATGRGECVPLDVSSKFESEPTQADVEAAGLAYLNANNTAAPTQNIKVSFARLQDMDEFADYEVLLQCELCDSITVIFPNYNTSGTFKIVKTVWNVLKNRFDEMELGALSVSLAEALGISNTGTTNGSGSGAATVIETGTSGKWKYRKWSDGTSECWGTHDWTISSWSSWGNTYYSTYSPSVSYPSGLFNATPTVTADGHASTGDCWLAGRSGGSKDNAPVFFLMRSSSGTNNITGYLNIHAIGKWQ